MVYGIVILRGIAALLVVFFHARYLVGSPRIENLLRNGAIGVDIFFVISGVVMYLHAPSLPVGSFVLRRLARILPFYWLFCIPKLILLLTLDVSARKVPLDLAYIVKSFLLIPAYDGEGQVAPIIRAGWTLSHEMYFYLICVPALLLCRARFLTVCLLVLAAGALAGTLVMLVVPGKLPAAVYLLAPLSLEFGAGMVAAHLWRRGLVAPAGMALLLLLAALIWLSWTPPMGQYTLERPLIWGIPAVAIVAAVMALETRVRFQRWAPLVVLGEASYSLYLCHTATVPIVHRLAGQVVTSPLAQLLIIVAISVAAGIAVHYHVERPLLGLIRRRRPPREPPGAPIPAGAALPS